MKLHPKLRLNDPDKKNGIFKLNIDKHHILEDFLNSIRKHIENILTLIGAGFIGIMAILLVIICQPVFWLVVITIILIKVLL